MKQIPWDFFAQRRNISYASFKNMSYEQYVRWCGRRNIIPLEEDVFQSRVNTQKKRVPTKQTKVVPPNPRNTDPKLLTKKKKAELVDLCAVSYTHLRAHETS